MILGGVEICETRTSWRILETSHPPTYYLPRSAFIEGSLRPARGTSFCEWKGRAAYLDVIGGSKIAPRAAWYYPQPEWPVCGNSLIMLRSMPVRWTSAWSMASAWCRSQAAIYGGWITSNVSGPFKGGPGTEGW